MKSRNSIVILLSAIIILPVVAAFTVTSNMQEHWWQRKKSKKAPYEFSTLTEETGYQLQLQFTPGKHHNHPLMAIWIEDTTGAYLQSLYVAKSIAKGSFAHAVAGSRGWEPGPARRPAALPYWGHKRGIKANDGYYLPSSDQPMPDAVSGPTPQAAFILNTKTRQLDHTVFNLLMEINQSWDWNQHWHNNKFPEDQQYKTSSQPAIVYRATIDVNNPQPVYLMRPVGHSHYAGASGELYEDLSTLTTALEIAKEIKVIVKDLN